VIPSAVFVDRDGTINQNAKPHEYITRWADFHFLPHAIEALHLLKRNNIPTIVITNQRGIQRKLYTEADLLDIHTRMQDELARNNADVTAVYFCPHGTEDNCDCRKPKPGMLHNASKAYDLDPTKSYMIDDAREGIEAGKRAGCKAILVLTGRGQDEIKTKSDWEYQPDYVAADLLAAVNYILEQPN
jgi:D-glycero-D-manno-heptose 1,7-bisphosphate phosphatase